MAELTKNPRASYRELSIVAGFNSTGGSIQGHIKWLERNGFITHQYGKSRTFVVLIPFATLGDNARIVRESKPSKTTRNERRSKVYELSIQTQKEPVYQDTTPSESSSLAEDFLTWRSWKQGAVLSLSE